MEKYNFGEDENYLLSQNLVGAKDFEMLTIAEQYAFTVKLVKGTTRFCQMQFIGSELIRIFDELAHESDWLNVEGTVIRLAYYKSELNIIHPAQSSFCVHQRNISPSDFWAEM